MRELKFRAWNGRYMVASSYGDWISFDGLAYTEADASGSRNIEIKKVNDYVIMQYTGSKDKTGKEIYEGDILHMKDEDDDTDDMISVVKFIDGGFIVEWDNHFNMGESDLTTIGWAIQEGHKIEVIGNIHENADLL